MDRRAFITNALLSAGFLAATAGAASALPGLPSHDSLAPAGNVENAWWYIAVLASALGMASALLAALLLDPLGSPLLVTRRHGA